MAGTVKAKRIEAPVEGLRALREKRGMSQSALARRLGCDKNTVSRWETGGFVSPANWRLLQVEFPELREGPNWRR